MLPNSASIKTPGWALVPDVGRNPLQGTPQSSMKRGRAARASNLIGGDTTTRQQNAVLKHLADLDEDSHRDVQIPVPKDNSARGMSTLNRHLLESYIAYVNEGSKKMTPNVRRILMSNKTFANHLADEEAALAQQQSVGPAIIPRLPVSNPTSLTPGTRRPAASELQSKLDSQGPSDEIVMTGMAPPALKDSLDNDPLLMVNGPQAPSAEEMNALLSAPPLSYNAARSAPPPVGKPQRHFCEICGYWGTIKCMKCGARVCGLDCKVTHDDGRCLKFYA